MHSGLLDENSSRRMQFPAQDTQMPRDSVQEYRPTFIKKAYRSRPERIWDGAGVFNISKILLPGETFLRPSAVRDNRSAANRSSQSPFSKPEDRLANRSCRSPGRGFMRL